MGNRSNDAGRKYGDAGTKRGRFNANPTRSNHAGCHVAALSRSMKKLNEKATRVVKVYSSNARGIFW